MTFGGFPQGAYGNGRETAQIIPTVALGLAWGEFAAHILPVGETAIPVASAKHLFRTPSLGGQARGSTTHLLAIFLSAVLYKTNAHRSVRRVLTQLAIYSRACPGSEHFKTSRTARETTLARGFLRGTLKKTKDVPCSTRS